MAVEEEEPWSHPATLSSDTDTQGGRYRGGMTQAQETAATMMERMGALNEKMGITIVEASVDRVVATMPVEGNTQPYGLLHGGASVVLAETLGSMGSALHSQPDRYPVGIDINATHHRSATSGTVTGVATPIHLGRTMASWEIVVTDEAGKRVCTSRITCALLPYQPNS